MRDYDCFSITYTVFAIIHIVLPLTSTQKARALGVKRKFTISAGFYIPILLSQSNFPLVLYLPLYIYQWIFNIFQKKATYLSTKYLLLSTPAHGSFTSLASGPWDTPGLMSRACFWKQHSLQRFKARDINTKCWKANPAHHLLVFTILALTNAVRPWSPIIKFLPPS